MHMQSSDDALSVCYVSSWTEIHDFEDLSKYTCKTLENNALFSKESSKDLSRNLAILQGPSKAIPFLERFFQGMYSVSCTRNAQIRGMKTPYF